MNLNQKLKEKQRDQIWQEYCGFLDLSLPQYMEIQYRLLLEQIELYADCELGQRIFNGKKPRTVEEFRKTVPLTTYEDYADYLLPKVESVLPATPSIWIQTTWEGGLHPVKVAPYSQGMVDTHRNISVAIMLLAMAHEKGQVNLKGRERFLYGMAPLPYLTGLVPHLIASQMPVRFMPSIQEAENMSFSERNKIGFKMGMQQGVDMFFGLSSIMLKMGDSFSSGSGSNSKINLLRNTPKMNYRLLKAWIKSKRERIPIMPKDIWSLKGLVCSGTDSTALKKRIEHYWGVKPLEIFGATESACIATEAWNKNGLIFFPDVDFYEFIPKQEMDKHIEDSSYIPSTYLIDELVPGNQYALVISNFKGGAFVRYITDDVFTCLSLSNEDTGIRIPQFSYVDRTPTVIDIAGFTRISESTVNEAVKISKLDIADWFAVKEYDNQKRAFMHLYVEVNNDGRTGLTKEIIAEHLAIYFRYLDGDYKDLKKLLGIDPLKVSIIPLGTINHFEDGFGRHLRRMNPSPYDVIEVMKIAHGKNRKEVC